MTKLDMTGVSNQEGQFVKELQGQTGVGFADGFHVHKDWIKNTKSYDEIAEAMQYDIDRRVDLMVRADEIKPGVINGEFVFVVNGRNLVPTDHALQQFSTKYSIPSSTILREYRMDPQFDSGDKDTMVDIATNALRKIATAMPDKIYRLRTYTDDTLRAVLTDKYAPIDNRWYMDVLKEFLPSGRISHWQGDADTIYGNILLPDTCIDYGQTDDSDYGAMLSIANCEIGTRRIGQQPSIFRSICMNGCIWGGKDGTEMRRRHIGNIDLQALKVDISRNIVDQLHLLPSYITKFLDTAKEFYGFNCSKKCIVAAAADMFRFDKHVTNEVFIQWTTYENDSNNLFGLINAITRAGQEYGPEQWLALDMVGGELANLSVDKWQKLVSNARSLTGDEIAKAYGEKIERK